MWFVRKRMIFFRKKQAWRSSSNPTPNPNLQWGLRRSYENLQMTLYTFIHQNVKRLRIAMRVCWLFWHFPSFQLSLVSSVLWPFSLHLTFDMFFGFLYTIKVISSVTEQCWQCPVWNIGQHLCFFQLWSICPHVLDLFLHRWRNIQSDNNKSTNWFMDKQINLTVLYFFLDVTWGMCLLNVKVDLCGLKTY